MSQLEKVVKLTRAQYDELINSPSHTITYSGGTHTYSDNNLYFITDETVSSDDLGQDFILDVPHGGTGKTLVTPGSVLVGNGTAALTELAATDQNTANTLVKRDANKGFSAGSITASGLLYVGTLDGGQHIFNGNIQLNAQSGSYNEGLRINRSTTGYANIYLGGTRSSASGSQTGGWWVGTYSTPTNATASGSSITNTTFTISQESTNDEFAIKGTRGATRVTNSGWAIRPRLAVGTTYQTDYTFYVNGTSFFSHEATLSRANNGTNFGLYVQHTNPNSDTTKSKKVGLMIGGQSGSGGVYDITKSKWIVYSDTTGNVTLNGNANSATEFSSAASVTLTGDVTGTASAKKGWSIATTIAPGAVTNEKLANSSIVIAGVTASLGGSVSLQDMGLSSAMHFKGVTTTDMTGGNAATHTFTGVPGGITGYSTPVAGDVVINSTNNDEWVCTNVNGTTYTWERLGSDSSYKIVQTAINSSTGTVVNSTAVNFIYEIAQDANGAITFKNRKLPVGTGSVTGIVQLGTGAAQAAKGNHTHSDYATTTGSNASGTWPISITGSAATATTSTYATKDSEGYDIASTYLPIVGGTITGTIASTTITTGALVIKGGIATQADSYLNKSVHIVGSASDNPLIVRGISGSNHLGQIDTTTPTNNGLYLNYNNGPVYLGQPSSTAASNYVQVYSQVQSTTFTNGALIVSGGVGIAKNANINGYVTIGGANSKIETSSNNDLYMSSAGLIYLDAGASKAHVFRKGGTEYARINPAGMFQISSTGTQNTHKLYVNGDSAFNGKIALGTQTNNEINTNVYMTWNNSTESLDFIFAS